MASRTYWVAPQPPLDYSDSAANATTSLTDTSPIPPVVLFGYQVELGTRLRIYAQGELTTGTTADTLTIGFYYGGVAGVALAAGAAIAVATGGVAETSVPWEMFYMGTIEALGSSGSIKGMGRFIGPNIATPLTGAMSHWPIPQTAAARTVTIDTTANKNITVGTQWSATTGAPTIKCYSLTLEVIG